LVYFDRVLESIITIDSIVFMMKRSLIGKLTLKLWSWRLSWRLLRN